MLNPEMRKGLTSQEDRLFISHCLSWPIPWIITSLDREFTDEERTTAGLQFAEGCCYRWVHE